MTFGLVPSSNTTATDGKKKASKGETDADHASKKKSKKKDPEQIALAYINDLNEEQVMKLIDQKFFNDAEQFDPIRHTIETLLTPSKMKELSTPADATSSATSTSTDTTTTTNAPDKLENITEEHFWKISYLHEKAATLLNQKLASTVMNNYTSFVQGMSKVQDIKMDLEDMTEVHCKQGRKKLQNAQLYLATGGLTIISKYRKRKNLMNLVYYLSRVQEITSMEKKLHVLLQDGDFPAAIQMMLNQKAQINQYKQLNCLKDVERNIQKGYDMIEKRIDDSLLTICGTFNSKNYEKVLIAYKLLGTHQQAPAKVVKYFTEAIDELTKNIVMSYAYRSPKGQRNTEKLVQMPLNELCNFIPNDEILKCVLEVFSELSELMYNYFSIWSWHNKKRVVKDLNDQRSQFDSYDFDYVKNTLGRSRRTLWDMIQSKVSFILGVIDFSHFKLERFLQIFHAISMFCELGEEYSENDSYKLRNSLKNKSRAFFFNYHRQEVMENLRLMISNESWHKLELPGFNLSKISEFNVSASKYKSSSSIYTEFAKKVRSFLHSDTSNSNPFKTAAEKGSFDIIPPEMKEGSGNGDYVSDDDDDEEEEEEEEEEDTTPDTKLMVLGGHKKEVHKEKPKKKKKKEGPMLTNVSLNILRRVGIYIHCMELLQPISLDVFVALTTLVSFYVYSVYSLFGNININTANPRELLIPENDVLATENLKDQFKRIRKALNLCNQEANIEAPFPMATLSEMIDLNRAPVYGIVEKITAIESLSYLVEALDTVNSKMQDLVPKPKVSLVEEFGKNMDSTIEDVKKVVLARALQRIISVDKYPAIIEKTNFMVTQMREQNPYVQTIAKDVKDFADKIDKVEEQIPQNVLDEMWREVLKGIMDALLEGFSRVKKCNHQGRSLMQQDATILESLLRPVVPLKPPFPGYIELKNYIQGFFCTEDMMKDWIKENASHYTSQQLISLINILPDLEKKKKEKQALITYVEELEKLSGDGPTTVSSNATSGTGSTTGNSFFKKSSSLFGINAISNIASQTVSAMGAMGQRLENATVKLDNMIGGGVSTGAPKRDGGNTGGNK